MVEGQNFNANNNQQGNFVICRASDVLKLIRTKEDRKNIAKENSKL